MCSVIQTHSKKKIHTFFDSEGHRATFGVCNWIECGGTERETNREVEVSNQEGQLERIFDDLTDVTVELRRVSHRKSHMIGGPLSKFLVLRVPFMSSHGGLFVLAVCH